MDLRRIRVLLVEDNREMGAIVRAVLASWNCTQVRTAESVAGSCPGTWCSWAVAEPLAKRASTRRRSE